MNWPQGVWTKVGMNSGVTLTFPYAFPFDVISNQLCITLLFY